MKRCLITTIFRIESDDIIFDSKKTESFNSDFLEVSFFIRRLRPTTQQIPTFAKFKTEDKKVSHASVENEKVFDDDSVVQGGFLTVPQAAEFLSIGKSLVYALMERGELRFCKFGKARRIPKASLAQFAKKQLSKPRNDD